MKKQIAVIGLGRFGLSLTKTLYELGHDVLAIDLSEKPVQRISSKVTHAIQADATDEAVLKELGISNFDAAAVTMGTAIQSSVLITILLKKLGVPYVIARAENELHGSILEKIGADKVIYVEHEMGISIAHGLTLPDVMDYTPITPSYGAVKMSAPDHFVGKSLAALELGRNGKWNIAVLLIGRKKEVIIQPEATEILQEGDMLILSGEDNNLEKALAETAKEKEDPNT